MVGEMAVREETGGSVDAVSVEDKTWVVGAVAEVPEVEIERQNPRKVRLGMVHGIHNPKGCIDECCAEVSRVPMTRTLEAWMPKKVEVGNRYAALSIDAVQFEEEVDEINGVEDDGKVRVTVDSGAAKSVWPRRKKGSTEEAYEE